MTAIPAAGYFTDPARTNLEAKQAQDQTLAVLRETIGGSAISTLTIASGSVTPTSGQHKVDTEGAAASDDLTTIQVTNLTDGRELLIKSVDNARSVVVKHAAGGVGQILLADGADFALSSTGRALRLMRVGNDWVETNRSWGGDKSSLLTWLGGQAAGSYVTTARQVLAGNGLTGGGALSGDVTVNVVGGNGIAVNANNIEAVYATQAECVAMNGVGVVSPPLSRHLLGSAKAWAKIQGSTGGIYADYGVLSCSRSSAGVYTFAWDNAFSTANYALAVTAFVNGGNNVGILQINNMTAINATIQLFNGSSSPTDFDFCIQAFGELA